jgi:hypothetical protein
MPYQELIFNACEKILNLNSKLPSRRPHNVSQRHIYNLRRYETVMQKKRKIGWFDIYLMVMNKSSNKLNITSITHLINTEMLIQGRSLFRVSIQWIRLNFAFFTASFVTYIIRGIFNLVGTYVVFGIVWGECQL